MSGGASDREMGFFAQRLGAELIADELVADRQRLDLIVAEAERLAAIGNAVAPARACRQLSAD